jgi:hypothetical protein
MSTVREAPRRAPVRRRPYWLDGDEDAVARARAAVAARLGPGVPLEQFEAECVGRVSQFHMDTVDLWRAGGQGGVFTALPDLYRRTVNKSGEGVGAVLRGLSWWCGCRGLGWRDSLPRMEGFACLVAAPWCTLPSCLVGGVHPILLFASQGPIAPITAHF